MNRQRLSCAAILATHLVTLPACLGDVEVPPEAPTLFPVRSPTAIPAQRLRGTKTAGTAVLNHGEVIVEAGEDENWEYEASLLSGMNEFELTTQLPSGLASRDSTRATIEYDPPCPDSPVLATPPPDLTTALRHSLAGTKPANSALILNGAVIVAASAATAWTHTLDLPDSDNTYAFSLSSRDAKNRDSAPTRFTIVLDRQAPTIRARYPAVDATAIPINIAMSISWDEGLNFAGEDPSPNMISVESGGSPVSGLINYRPEANALLWIPDGGIFAADSVFSVTIDASLVKDHAGNMPSGGNWTWNFTTGSSVDASAPATPTVDATASTKEPSVVLQGSKDANTSIWLEDKLVVGIDALTTWSYQHPIAVGVTPLTINAKSASGTGSPTVSMDVTRTIDKPAPPAVDAASQTTVSADSVSIAGTKPANTSILLDGSTVVCQSSDGEWGYIAEVVPGFNDFTLQTEDADGNRSDPITHSVNFEQVYTGKVPQGYGLQVFFTLRDLSRVAEVRDEFITGASNYSIDAWIEGPIDDGETCVFDGVQRNNIKYVATIEHYMGAKAQHEVPYDDEDYRGGDYLAALISGGVYSFKGLGPGTPRRDANGKTLVSLMAGLTSAEMRSNIDCLGIPTLDACTSATVSAGPKALPTWTPRARNGQGLLDQGNYLLQIMINLDRDPSWLTENDFETCWGNPSHIERGMHRITRRVGLGDASFNLDLPQSVEFSGLDNEGSGKLNFISQDGITIYWGPQQ